jgi:hypothetical protein
MSKSFIITINYINIPYLIYPYPTEIEKPVKFLESGCSTTGGKKSYIFNEGQEGTLRTMRISIFMSKI